MAARMFPSPRMSLTLFLAMMLLVSFAYPTWLSVRSPSSNDGYSPNELAEVVMVIQREVASSRDVAPKIAARNVYLSYFAGGISVDLAYTDYDGLVRYCRLNDVDYVFLEYNRGWGRPFHERFKRRETPDFQLLYAREAEFGNSVELYRFIGGSVSSKPPTVLTRPQKGTK